MGDLCLVHALGLEIPSVRLMERFGDRLDVPKPRPRAEPLVEVERHVIAEPKVVVPPAIGEGNSKSQK